MHSHWWEKHSVLDAIRIAAQAHIDKHQVTRDEEPRLFDAICAGIEEATGNPPVFAEGSLWIWDADFGIWSRCCNPATPREGYPNFGDLWSLLSELKVWTFPKNAAPRQTLLRLSAKLESALDRQPHRRTRIAKQRFFQEETPGIILPTIDQGETIPLLWEPHADGTVSLTDPEPQHRKRHLLFGADIKAQAIDAEQVLKPPRAAAWQAYLRTIWKEDPEFDAKVEILEGFIGTVLTSTATRFQRMLIWQGASGANGKSMLAEVIATLVVADSSLISTCSPADWEGFGASTLDGKLLNIVTELPEEKVFHSHRVKAIVAGDPVHVDVKYAQAYKMLPTTGHLLAVNRLPAMRDLSGGLKRRLLIQDFNHSFLDDADRKSKEEILDLLRPVASEIRVRCLHAAARLMEAGDYTLTEEHKRAVDELEVRSSSATAFVDACCSQPPRGVDCAWWEYQHTLYRAYVRYCQALGIRSVGSGQKFFKDLEMMGLVRETSKGGGRRKFFSIALRPVEEWGVGIEEDDPNWQPR
tara:strand:+ start:5371 stop:6948 length:1578 start_codon:yes stop_codon:yes gene_type:complete